MLATLIAEPFDDPEWVFETKWDGVRAVAEVISGKARLYSRNGNDLSARFPAVVRALMRLDHDAILDGELAAFDRTGISRFQLLQNVRTDEADIAYCVFDLMSLDGQDLRRRPLLERKELLRQLIPIGKYLRYSTHRPRAGVSLFRAAAKAGLEGIIAKRAASTYQSGIRSRDWLKIKASLEQEVVIMGYTAPRGARKYFGALVLGVRGPAGWEHVGSAGTGFDVATLASLHERMLPLRSAERPFDHPIPHETSVTWLRPELVAEVRFTEWTAAGQMRHPVYLGIREDKPAIEVVREIPSS
jgi:bifunctional non-homologous end joining protein LigD